MRYAIVDLESTGSRLEEGDRIIQIGAVIVEDHQVVDQQEMLINPQREIPIGIQQLTGIGQDQVDQAPCFAQVAGLWMHKLQDCVFLAHNLNHDLRFLVAEFKKAGFDFQPKAIDTVLLTKMVLPQASGFNLTDLSQDLGLAFDQAHQALADAWQTHCLVDYLARQLAAMPRSLREDLTAISRHLPHDEVAFFEGYSDFILQEAADRSLEVKQGSLKPLDSLQAAQKNRIMDLLADKRHLVIEGKDRPLSVGLIQALVRDYLTSGERKILVACSGRSDLANWEAAFGGRVPYAVQLRRADYLDLTVFDHYCRLVDLAQLNQHELVVLAATKSWLQATQTGRLDELNPEITIQAQVDRLVDRSTVKGDHPFYQRALQQAKQSNLVLTLDSVLVSQGASLGQGRLLVICDLQAYQDQVQVHMGRSLSLSQVLMALQQVEEDIQQGYYESRSILSQVHQAKVRIRRLVNLLEGRFQQAFEWGDLQVNRDLYLAGEDSLVRQGLEDLNQVLQVQTFLASTDLTQANDQAVSHLQALNQAIDQAKNLLQAMQDPTGYHFVRALEVQGNYYQMAWHYRPMKLDQANPAHFSSAPVLMVSQGGFTREGASRSILGLTDYAYWALPSYQPVINFQVPEDYLVPTLNHDHSISQQAEELALLIQDRTQQVPATTRHLLVVNNRQQALALYQAVKAVFQADSQVRVFSQHASGSLNKIRRAVNDRPGGVIILQWQSILRESFRLEEGEVEVYWLRLPFAALGQPAIQGLAAYLGLRSDQVFDRLLVDRMIDHWVQAVDYLDQHFEVNQWWLLDERIFTKYYSKEIRQKLESSMGFNLEYKL